MSPEEPSSKRGGVLDLLGSVVAGKYRIDRLIGQGGMGAVFQATNLSIGKRVALKFLSAEAAREKDAAERFQREALAASLVESSHIVQIFDSGTHAGGLPFLVMELLSGEDLRSRLKRERRLSVDVAVGVAIQVLRALVRAHDVGIVHRDLKPENVFLCERDDGTLWVKIVDFGISKLARTGTLDTLTGRGMVLGTAYYMSPEQAQAFQDIDGRADLFSVGAILYECLTGRPPHSAPTYEAVLIAICTKDAEDLRTFVDDASEALAGVVKKALARNREERFQTAHEFLEELNASASSLAPGSSFSKTDSAPERPPSAELASHSSQSMRRTPSPRTLAIAALATLSGFGLTGLWAFQNRTPAAASEPTEKSASTEARVPKLPASMTSPMARPAAAPIQSVAASPTVATGASAANAALSASSNPASGSASRASAPREKRRQGVAQGLTLSTREP